VLRFRQMVKRGLAVCRRLELVLGSNLQHIRINGTIVGALVGCAIYLLSMATA
jgi:uncharacterized membrane-anchored protein YjiN (DUF445 family)